LEIYHIILAVCTGIYLILCAWWDLRDRMIYTFPCMMLTWLWVGYCVMSGEVEPKVLLAYIVLFSVFYITFALTKAWGGGDSDLLLLFGAVYLAQMKGGFSLADISSQCISIAIILLIAALVGFVEAKIKGEKLEKDSSIAIAPGYAVVISFFMIGGFL